VVRAVEIDAGRRVEVIDRGGELWAVVVPSGFGSQPPASEGAS
jgi:hypothetical protein